MKIGIATYHRSENYGALLQAIALRQVLQQIGHKVYYIDYWPSHQRSIYAIPRLSWKFMLKHPLRGLSLFRDNILKHKRKANFRKFINKYITPYCRSVEEEYDIIVYGSDQIWRKQDNHDGKEKCYNPFYFGVNSIKAKKSISYAASSDNILLSREDRETFRALLSHLDAISVREDSMLSEIKSLGFINAELSLDPTLMLGRNTWDKIIPTNVVSSDKYVLYYDLQDCLNLNDVIEFTVSRGLVLKRIVGRASFPNETFDDSTCSPYGFLQYVKNADFVITSSFHGLVFAIIYHKPFIVSCSYSPYRMRSLLKSIGCEDRMVPVRSNLHFQFKDIDYDVVEMKLSEIRKSSFTYLVNNLNFNYVKG